MKGRKSQKPCARLGALAAAVVAGLALAACGNLFNAESGVTETRVVVSSDVTALLDEAGLDVASWTLMCYFASGNYMEETSASGVFSVQFSDDDIAAVFAKPAFASAAGLAESSVPGIGAIYPYFGELSGGGVKSGARLELGFYGGVAAEAARLIFLGAPSADDAARLARAFNWSKFDSHIKTATSAVSYPLLIDTDKFLAAFFEGNTSMYWQVRSLSTEETAIAIPDSLRSCGGTGIVFPYYYPDYNLDLEVDEDGSLPETIAVDLPDGLWFFFVKGSGKWLAVQASGGAVAATYSSDSI